MIKFEPLQPRQLMAATPIATPTLELRDNLTLAVIGSFSDDQITVTPYRNVEGQSQLTILSGNQVQTTFRIRRAEVRRILIMGGEGNDTITVDPRVTLSTTLVGGSGNDTIFAGGGGDAVVDGSAGNDVIGATRSSEVLMPTGATTMVAGVLSVRLWRELPIGGPKSIMLMGGKGNDVIYARRGHVVFGGDGKDYVPISGDDEAYGRAQTYRRYDLTSDFITGLALVGVEYVEVRIT